MKKIFSFLISLIIILAVAFGVVFFSAFNEDFDTFSSITINDIQIEANSGFYEQTFLPFFPPIEKHGTNYIENLTIFKTSSRDFNIDLESEYTASVVLNDEEVYYGNNINNFHFLEVGEYVIKVTIPFTNENKTGYYDYSFIVETIEDPTLSISNTNPNQGDLVFVEIQNVFNEYDVDISSKYAPSASIFIPQENKIEFYIPINYMVQANDFLLEISLTNDDTSYNFSENISVGATEYETISFTMPASVEDSTVNSANANQEYRDTIHPLYYTKDMNVYWEGNFIKPTDATRVSSDFGQIRYINGVYSRHSGIDYADATGTAVYAANNGIIEYAGFLQLSGNTIVIEHGLGLKSYYMHMDSLDVETGNYVTKGDFVGTIGTTGYSTGPHLHYQVSIENQPVDPVDLYTLFDE